MRATEAAPCGRGVAATRFTEQRGNERALHGLHSWHITLEREVRVSGSRACTPGRGRYSTRTTELAPSSSSSPSLRRHGRPGRRLLVLMMRPFRLVPFRLPRSRTCSTISHTIVSHLPRRNRQASFKSQGRCWC